VSNFSEDLALSNPQVQSSALSAFVATTRINLDARFDIFAVLPTKPILLKDYFMSSSYSCFLFPLFSAQESL
jgi:hypothetical protein